MKWRFVLSLILFGVGVAENTHYPPLESKKSLNWAIFWWVTSIVSIPVVCITGIGALLGVFRRGMRLDLRIFLIPPALLVYEWWSAKRKGSLGKQPILTELADMLGWI